MRCRPCQIAGDKPELLYPEAAAELRALGHASTLEYVGEAGAAVLRETGLLPHINAGVMGARKRQRSGHCRHSLAIFSFDANASRCPRPQCLRSGRKSTFPLSLRSGATDLRALRRVSASQGLMLESTSKRLLEQGQAHWDCPDKVRCRPRFFGTLASWRRHSSRWP
jgi:FO synthase